MVAARRRATHAILSRPARRAAEGPLVFEEGQKHGLNPELIDAREVQRNEAQVHGAGALSA